MENGDAWDCAVCGDMCRAAVTTPCCDARSCWSCGLAYVLTRGKCWALDCSSQLNADNLMPDPQLRERIRKASAQSESSRPCCELCQNVIRHRVGASCCGAQACRRCACRFIKIYRICWGDGCLTRGLQNKDLVATETDEQQTKKTTGEAEDVILRQPHPAKEPDKDVIFISATGSAELASRLSHKGGLAEPASQQDGSEAEVELLEEEKDDNLEEEGQAQYAHESSDEGEDSVRIIEEEKQEQLPESCGEEDMDMDEEEEQDEQQEPVLDHQSPPEGIRDDSYDSGGDRDAEDNCQNSENSLMENPSGEARSEANGHQSSGDENGSDSDSSCSAVAYRTEPGKGSAWEFVQGMGWCKKKSSQVVKDAAAASSPGGTPSTWIKDENGWSVRVKPPVAAAPAPAEKRAAEEAKNEAKRSRTEPSDENICQTLGKATMYGSGDNYIMLRLRGRDAAATHIDNAWVNYSNDLMRLAKSQLPPSAALKKLNQKCRILRPKGDTDSDAFIFLNVQFHDVAATNASLAGKSSPAIPVLELPASFKVATFTALRDKATVPQTPPLSMDLWLEPDKKLVHLDRCPRAVRVALKFKTEDGEAEVEERRKMQRREVAESLFWVSQWYHSRIEILTLVFRPLATRYSGGSQRAASSELIAVIMMRSSGDETVTLVGNQVIAEVRTCENSSVIPDLFHSYDYSPGGEASDDIVSINSSADSEDDSVVIETDEPSKEPAVADNGSAPTAGANWFESLGAETRQQLAEARQEEGNGLLAKACFQLAAKKYAEAILLEPENATYWAKRASCHLGLNNGALGLEDAEKALELRPGYVEAHLRAAKAAIMLGNLLKAKAHLVAIKDLSGDKEKKVMEADKDNIDEENNIDDKDSEEADQNKEELDKNEEEECDIAAEDWRTVDGIEQLRADLKVSMAEENWSRALDIVKDLRHLSPCQEDLSLTKAEILAMMGTFEESNRIINDIKGFNSNPDCLYVKALCLYYKDSPDLAGHFLKEVFKLQPEHAKATAVHNRMEQLRQLKEEAALKINTGEYEEALTIYDEALLVDPKNKLSNSKLHHSKAVVLGKLTRHLDSIDQCNEAIEKDRLLAKAYYTRAKSYLELEMYEEACRDSEHLVRSDVNNQSYRQLYQQAKRKNEESKNFYKLLGVDKKATQEEIRKAYRKAALVHHPDRHSTSPENLRNFHERRFKDIGEAYSVLSDEAKRLLYDKGLLGQASIVPTHQSATTSAFYATGAHIHPTNLAQTFAQAQTAAFWATFSGPGSRTGGGAVPGRSGRAGGGVGLAGAMPGRGAGLAGAAGPFLFMPGAAGAATGAPQFNMNGINLSSLFAAPRFGFQQHHPFNKF